MIFLIATAFSVIIALMLGGRLDAMAEVRLRATWLVLLAASFKLFELLGGAGPYVLPGELAAVLLFAALNLGSPGMAIIAAGSLLNLAVIAVNGGYMPIAASGVAAVSGATDAVTLSATGRLGDYVLLSPGTRLGWLADVILTPPPVRRVLSPGDALIILGLVMAVLAAARTPTPRVVAQVVQFLHKASPFLNSRMKSSK